MKIVADALKRGEKTLSEYESKKVLDAYSIPVTKELVTTSLLDAKSFAREIGYPVALKGSSSTLTHKTELNLIELNIKDEEALEKAYNDLEERGQGKLDGILVQQMIKGEREFVAGLIRDPQFGPCVMFGLRYLHRGAQGCDLQGCPAGEEGCPGDDGRDQGKEAPR